VRVFESRWFCRFARKERISDAALLDSVARAEKGLIDADLGGGVIKQRIPRVGAGRSKGYRALIFFRRGTRAFFIYGFAKNNRANITAEEEREFKIAAGHVLALTGAQLAELLDRGDFVEIEANDQEIS
jgi:hypothetical protein